MSSVDGVVQDSWPPRILVTATLTSPGSTVTIYRIANNRSIALRGAKEVVVVGTALVVVDAEFPFSTPVLYVLVENGANVDTSPMFNVTLPGGKVALTDAVSGLAAEVVILAEDPQSRDAQGTVYTVDGLAKLVSGPLGEPTQVVEYFTETLTARDDLRALLDTCTNGIYLQRGPSGGYDVDRYHGVLKTDERRWSQDGSDERRVTAVSVTHVQGWPGSLEARGYTYEDVADVYFGLDYADVAADYASYLALAQGDFGS